MNHPVFDRIVVDGLDREPWLAARVGKIGGSDAGRYAKEASAHLYIRDKLGEQWNGNAYTAHGNDRERHILAAYNIRQNRALFRSEGNPLHVCTPDGIVVGGTGDLVLAQVKTTGKPITKIPPVYARQMWWEQYVMGADRTLFIWEQHDDFQPVAMEPESMWFYRDDTEIDKLVRIANLVLDGISRAEAFRKELA